MTNPQEQFGELTRRTQENFKHLWEQWTQRSNELLKGVGRSRSVGGPPGNPEQVLDAVTSDPRLGPASPASRWTPSPRR